VRDYSKIGPQFWIGTTGKRLRAAGPDAQIVAMYLLTSPHANMLGLFYCPLAFIAHETGLSFEGASKGLQSSIDAGFCRYDEDSEVVWVIEMASFQVGECLKEGDLRVKGVQNEYNSLPENPYLSEFFDKYAADFLMSYRREADSPYEAPSKTLRSQEQEQEKEQEKEKGAALPLCTLTMFIENKKTANEKIIPDSHAVFNYAKAAGIPAEFLSLAWNEFKSRYTTPPDHLKKYKDWPGVFLKAVKGNWMKVWFIEGGMYKLTTAGQQAEMARGAHATH
jgi:hypothetical protein